MKTALNLMILLMCITVCHAHSNKYIFADEPNNMACLLFKALTGSNKADLKDGSTSISQEELYTNESGTFAKREVEGLKCYASVIEDEDMQNPTDCACNLDLDIGKSQCDNLYSKLHAETKKYGDGFLWEQHVKTIGDVSIYRTFITPVFSFCSVRGSGITIDKPYDFNDIPASKTILY